MAKLKYSIIGSGVIGLSIAYFLSKTTEGDIAVFEKNHSFGEEISSRNSEVIHAGLYYPPSSLKSILCKRGNDLLYDLCVKENIPYKKCGKIIVSTDEDEDVKLKSIFDNAVLAGVPDIELIDRKKVNELEPEIFALNGILSKTTGIIDVHGLMRHLYQKTSRSGVMYMFNSEISSIKRTNNGYVLGYSGGNEVLSEYVINCAGLESHNIASMAGLDIDRLGYRLHYCKGDYFSVSCEPNKLSHLVYPVPDKEGYGLGIHSTLNLDGYIKLGPDTAYVGDKKYDVDASKASGFYTAAKKYLPWLKEAMVVADSSGIRPKLQGPGDGFRDFVIKEESKNGFPGFINLIGIESPGLTACLAIGEMVSKIAVKQ